MTDEHTNDIFDDDAALQEETHRAMRVLNCGGPSPAELFLVVRAERRLDARQARHVDACRTCQQWIELLEVRRLVPADEGHKARRPRVLLSINARRLAIPASLAAAVLLAVGLLWMPTSPARADIYSDAVNAGSAWFRLVGSMNFILDPDSEEAKVQQQELARLQRSVREGLEQLRQAPPNDPSITPFCQDWQALYVLLRNLGQRDEAVSQSQAAVEFAKARVPAFVPVFLDGLANIHAAYGEYLEARQGYLESIELRRANVSVDWKKDPHYGEPHYEGHLGWGITPMYLRLMHVSLAEGKLAEAREWYSAAQRAMAQRIRTTLEMLDARQAGKTSPGENPSSPTSPLPPADAILWDLWIGLPAEYQRPKLDDQYTPEELRQWADPYWPTPALPAWVRTTFYHEALLLHAEDNHDAARAALERAARIEYYPDSSEFPLPFLEKLELARLAVIRKDYSAALAAVRAARDLVLDPLAQPTSRGPAVNLLPMTPVRAAELDLLEGIVLLAQKPTSADGRVKVSKAMKLPTKLADGLARERRETFAGQFQPWKQLTIPTPLSTTEE